MTTQIKSSVSQALDKAAQSTDDFLAQVATLASYGAFVAAKGPKRRYLAVSRFNMFRAVIMYEVFATDLSKAEVMGMAGVSEKRYEDMHKSRDYLIIKKLILQAAIDTGTPQTMQEASATFEAPLVSGVLTTALFGQGRDRLKAIDEFHGRQSSKKGREAEEIRVRLPPEFEELIARASKIVDVTPKLKEKSKALPAADSLSIANK